MTPYQNQNFLLNSKRTKPPKPKGKPLSKRVYICGRGALGLTLGTQLAQHLKNFAFIVDAERKERYVQQKVKVNGKQASYRYITPEEVHSVEKADLIFFACKYLNILEALYEAKDFIGPKTILMSGMNGIESEKILKSFFPNNPVILTVAQNMDPVYDSKNQELYFTTPGEIVFGPLESFSLKKDADEIEELFQACEVPYIYSDDILLDQYRKLMFNCGISQVCAAFDVTYGEVANDPDLSALFRQVMEETRKVIASFFGKDPGQESLENWVKKISTFNPDSFPSMAQDLKVGRWTEFDLFSGIIVPLGIKVGIETPVNTILAQKILEKQFEIMKRNEEKVRDINFTYVDSFFQESQLFWQQVNDWAIEMFGFLGNCEKSIPLNQTEINPALKRELPALKEEFPKLYEGLEKIKSLCTSLIPKSEEFQRTNHKRVAQLKNCLSLIKEQINLFIFLGLLGKEENVFGQEREDHYFEVLEAIFEKNDPFLQEARNKKVSLLDIDRNFSGDFLDIADCSQEIKEDLNEIQVLLTNTKAPLVKINNLLLEIEAGKRSTRALFKKLLFYVNKVKDNMETIQLKLDGLNYNVSLAKSHLEKIQASFVKASADLNKRQASVGPELLTLWSDNFIKRIDNE